MRAVRWWPQVTDEQENEAVKRILKAWGPPHKIEERLIALDLLIEADARRRWLYRGIVGILKAFFAVAAVWVAVKVMFGDVLGFFDGFGK
jgi:hypothetical protein